MAARMSISQFELIKLRHDVAPILHQIRVGHFVLVSFSICLALRPWKDQSWGLARSEPEATNFLMLKSRNDKGTSL